jgi:hypothetical protein
MFGQRALGPLQLRGFEGGDGLGIWNFLSRAFIGKLGKSRELAAAALSYQGSQLGVVIGEVQERGGRGPLLAHEQEWRCR